MEKAVDLLEVLRNPATSYWLRDAIQSALKRDAVDALADAELLTALLAQRLAELQAPPPADRH